MFKLRSLLCGACAIMLLASAATPGSAQLRKSAPHPHPQPRPVVSPAPRPAVQKPFRPVQPFAPFGQAAQPAMPFTPFTPQPAYRGPGLNPALFGGNAYLNSLNTMPGMAANNSLLSALTNSPFVNQMQQGYLPGSNIPNPWSLPNPYMSPFMNPAMMMNPMMNNPYMMNPYMYNPMMANPYMNTMMMNPMMSNMYMNPMMSNMYMNPMMMYNPMMVNPMTMPAGYYASPYMMQPGIFGPMNNPFNMIGQPAFPRGF